MGGGGTRSIPKVGVRGSREVMNIQIDGSQACLEGAPGWSPQRLKV